MIDKGRKVSAGVSVLQGKCGTVWGFAVCDIGFGG